MVRGVLAVLPGKSPGYCASALGEQCLSAQFGQEQQPRHAMKQQIENIDRTDERASTQHLEFLPYMRFGNKGCQPQCQGDHHERTGWQPVQSLHHVALPYRCHLLRRSLIARRKHAQIGPNAAPDRKNNGFPKGYPYLAKTATMLSIETIDLTK